jgi:hypothetical protein
MPTDNVRAGAEAWKKGSIERCLEHSTGSFCCDVPCGFGVHCCVSQGHFTFYILLAEKLPSMPRCFWLATLPFSIGGQNDLYRHFELSGAGVCLGRYVGAETENLLLHIVLSTWRLRLRFAVVNKLYRAYFAPAVLRPIPFQY